MFKKQNRTIQNRNSTLNYELMKTLQSRIVSPNIGSLKWYNAFKSRKVCSYCNSTIKGKTSGDHLYNVVGNSLTNVSSICVPCCSSCNSAKGSLNWRDYVERYHKEIHPDNLEFIQKVDKFIQENMVKFDYDVAMFEEIKAKIVPFLDELALAISNISIVKN